MSSKRDLTKGGVFHQLMRLGLPMMWGIFAIISFSIVDTFYIGRLGGDALAALGFTFPVTMLVFNVVFGFVIAMSACVSRRIGEKKYDEVRAVIIVALALTFIVSVVIAIVGILTIDPLFSAMGAEGAVLDGVKDYMTISYISFAFLSLPMVANSAIRATGDTLWPALIMTFVAVVNGIIDPLLIFGMFGLPRLEIQGAALASAISHFLAMLLGLWILGKREKLLDPMMLFVRNTWRISVKPILTVAVPVAIGNVIVPVLAVLITEMIADYGNSAVAGFGVATRLESFALIPIMALASAMSPFVGQNFGAKEYARIDESFSIVVRLGAAIGIVSFVVFGLFGGGIVSIFTSDVEAVRAADLYLKIVAISYAGLGWFAIFVSTMNTLGMPKRALVLNVMKAFCVTLPACFVGQWLAGLTGLYVAIAVSHMTTGCYLLWWRYQVRQKGFTVFSGK